MPSSWPSRRPSRKRTNIKEDPDATIPSSPTLFMKRPATDSSSLHHLPTMYLPESAVSASAQGHKTSCLTPSTLPAASSLSSSGRHGSNNNAHRKMSISSQGSSSSAQSNGSGGERTKEYGCTIGSCEKKFYQVAHLRSHERCHSGTRPYVSRQPPPSIAPYPLVNMQPCTTLLLPITSLPPSFLLFTTSVPFPLIFFSSSFTFLFSHPTHCTAQGWIKAIESANKKKKKMKRKKKGQRQQSWMLKRDARVGPLLVLNI
ncbi:hypothetical protein K457DRAFT_819277 [Linnemannia elongata AG-77]|uniref:C2H2-type domain-containing protein n=1 Tax=Linnemannia elongata AG-77 TaxID=1314771 RepID=A0A197KAK2_9FUNG|nr:hypothetical protein K457DRAFT_819277 [Linnemannia elongata AG-77]